MVKEKVLKKYESILVMWGTVDKSKAFIFRVQIKHYYYNRIELCVYKTTTGLNHNSDA